MVTGLARLPSSPPMDRRHAPFGFDPAVLAWRLLCAFTLSIPFSIFVAKYRPQNAAHPLGGPSGNE